MPRAPRRRANNVRKVALRISSASETRFIQLAGGIGRFRPFAGTNRIRFKGLIDRFVNLSGRGDATTPRTAENDRAVARDREEPSWAAERALNTPNDATAFCVE